MVVKNLLLLPCPFRCYTNFSNYTLFVVFQIWLSSSEMCERCVIQRSAKIFRSVLDLRAVRPVRHSELRENILICVGSDSSSLRAPFRAQRKYSDLCVGSESRASGTMPSVAKRLYAKHEWPRRDEQSSAVQRCLIYYPKSTRHRKVFSFWIHKIDILFIIQSHFFLSESMLNMAFVFLDYDSSPSFTLVGGWLDVILWYKRIHLKS
jgi:hypothetical protein